MKRNKAIAIDGTKITFECPLGHRYTIDYSKKPVARRMDAWACKFMYRYWTKDGSGVSGTCRKCKAIAGK